MSVDGAPRTNFTWARLVTEPDPAPPDAGGATPGPGEAPPEGLRPDLPGGAVG